MELLLLNCFADLFAHGKQRLVLQVYSDIEKHNTPFIVLYVYHALQIYLLMVSNVWSIVSLYTVTLKNISLHYRPVC